MTQVYRTLRVAPSEEGVELDLGDALQPSEAKEADPMEKQLAEVSGMSSRQRWTLVLVCTAVFMLLLDITVVSVALPSIQRDLRASLPDLQWVSAAYALVLAVLLLPAATLGDRLGRRRLFLVGLVIFTAGSLACALAPTALALELFRALQGAGAVLFATGTPL